MKKSTLLHCLSILTLSLFVLFAVGTGEEDTNNSSTNSIGNSNTNSIGDVVVLKHSQAPSFLAVDSDAWDKMTEAIYAQDKTGIRKLMRRREVFLIKEDLKAKILDIGFTSYKIRITSGPHEGKAGWVYRELVTGKN